MNKKSKSPTYRYKFLSCGGNRQSDKDKHTTNLAEIIALMLLYRAYRPHPCHPIPWRSTRGQQAAPTSRRRSVLSCRWTRQSGWHEATRCRSRVSNNPTVRESQPRALDGIFSNARGHPLSYELQLSRTMSPLEIVRPLPPCTMHELIIVIYFLD